MNWQPIPLSPSGEQISNLKSRYARLAAHLEDKQPLRLSVLESLRDELTQVVRATPAWREALEQVNNSGDFYAVQLLHSDNEILNLPWALAEDPYSGRQLATIRRLFLTRSLPDYVKPPEQASAQSLAPPPLKILIMISSPVDTRYEQRLSYEDEEFLILSAFERLMQSGQVEIDFTDDGSLDALERKLKGNQYHILHFSGHGVFKDGAGYLQLEDPLTLKTRPATGADFAEALNCNPDHKIPLLVLSSCQTAQGGSEAGLRGITNHLLKAGFPAVISMGMSIKDVYAARFAAHFYRGVAEKQSIPPAFQAALRWLQEQEYNDLVEARAAPPVPLQWLIPNLYLTERLETLLDWRAPRQDLRLTAHRFVTGQKRLLLEHGQRYVFIGRRREKVAILAPFFDKKPVLLKGQGGVGKTAMAEYLVQRLIAAEPRTEPFVFDETVKSIQEVLARLQAFLMERGCFEELAGLDRFDKGLDRFQYLLHHAGRQATPVFVFDNLETFQRDPGGEFAPEHQDLAEVIEHLCRRGREHLILTARYPLPGFSNLREFDLNQAGLTDFWKRCHYLELGRLQTELLKQARAVPQPGLAPLKFIDIVELLHRTFGGNYRALEFFDRLLAEKPGEISAALRSMEELGAAIAAESEAVRERMREDLQFSLLLQLLDGQAQALLGLLAHFRLPVQKLALRLQDPGPALAAGLDGLLDRLHRLTLIEVSLDPETLAPYYYATPLVKDLLAGAGTAGAAPPFSAHRAGVYHYHIYRNIEPALTEAEEAFRHFYAAGDGGRVQTLGDELSAAYYRYSLYHNAFHYASQTYRLLGAKTGPGLQNRLGLLYGHFGRYGPALGLYQAALAAYRAGGDKSGEGTTLNNISQIYDARGDYETALQYLQASLKIRQEIGDKSGEGRALNNIGGIYRARGDYETALQYLQASLKIRQEIGDKSGKGTTLNNMATTAYARGDYETALQYLQASLKIRQEIGDKSGKGTTLNNMATTAYARGDYETALQYLQASLKIRQEIGDKSGQIPTLYNLAMIAREQGDQRQFIERETAAYQLALETGDAMGLYQVGIPYGQFLYATGQKEEGAAVLKRSYDIGRQGQLPGLQAIEKILREWGAI